jgi:hypothetical protein
MKKLIIISAIALLGLASCKKETPIRESENAVIYTIICDSCTATIDTRKGVKEINVKGFYQLGEMNRLTSMQITTTGTGSIKSSIKVNDVYLHKVENIQNGETLAYNVKL